MSASAAERRRKEAKLAMQKQLLDISLYGPRSASDREFIHGVERGRINLDELNRPVWENIDTGLDHAQFLTLETVKDDQQLTQQEVDSLKDEVQTLKAEMKSLLESFERIKAYFEDIHGVLEQARQEDLSAAAQGHGVPSVSE